MPPRPPSFPGKLVPTPSPVSENQNICTSLSADVVSSYMCTNYCNNPKATSKDTTICQYCPDASCNNSSITYSERDTCTGKMIIDPSIENIMKSTPTWICNQNYKLNNVCDGFTKDTGKAAANVGAPNDFYQCILTPNNECIPAVNKCKLPNRLDSSNEIVEDITTVMQDTKIHYIINVNAI